LVTCRGGRASHGRRARAAHPAGPPMLPCNASNSRAACCQIALLGQGSIHNQSRGGRQHLCHPWVIDSRPLTNPTVSLSTPFPEVETAGVCRSMSKNGPRLGQSADGRVQTSEMLPLFNQAFMGLSKAKRPTIRQALRQASGRDRVAARPDLGRLHLTTDRLVCVLADSI